MANYEFEYFLVIMQGLLQAFAVSTGCLPLLEYYSFDRMFYSLVFYYLLLIHRGCPAYPF